LIDVVNFNCATKFSKNDINLPYGVIAYDTNNGFNGFTAETKYLQSLRRSPSLMDDPQSNKTEFIEDNLNEAVKVHFLPSPLPANSVITRN
jgi:hypothetical protein